MTYGIARDWPWFPNTYALNIKVLIQVPHASHEELKIAFLRARG